MTCRASDAQLLTVLQTLDTLTLFSPVRQCLLRNPDYSYVMLHQERLQHDKVLPPLAERIQVRYRHAPRAGQEILYDASLDPQHVRTHSGGFLNRMIFNVAIDGLLAQT